MIRGFRIEDLDRVMELWLETNIQAHPFIDASYWRENSDRVREGMRQATVFVYEDQGEVQGFVGLTDGHMAGIFVASDWQSQGIGKLLLDRAKDGHAELTLCVYQENTAAFRFYLREGFVVHKEQRDKNTGEIELFMVWTK